MSFIAELKRRNVLRVVVGYAAFAWLLIQIVETLFPIYGLSDAAMRIVIAVLGIGAIPVIVLAWAFELTPDGLKRDSDMVHDTPASRTASKRLDRYIMTVLALALAYFVFDEFVIEPPAATNRSIAVLPFVNMSSDPEQAYLAEGLSEELLNLLARIPELRVTSRSSSFQFKGDALDLREVAAKLNVAHILEGSVRTDGEHVRITAQLIEAETDAHVWSETYDRSLDDIFAIQDDVALQVVDQLRLELLGEMPKTRPVNPQAYTLMLAAREIVHLQRRDEYERAEELLKKALEIEPDYVEALSQLGLVYWAQRRREFPRQQQELTDLIHETRGRVMEIDPENATVMAAIAWDHLEPGSGNGLKQAARLYESASEIEPSNFYVLRGSGILAEDLGNEQLALSIFEYLVERDPMTIWNYHNLARAHYKAGRYEEALRQYEMAASLSSNSQVSYNWNIGFVRLLEGYPEAALESFEQISDEVYRTHSMSLALYDLGRQDEAIAALDDLQKLMADWLAPMQDELSPADLLAAQWPKGFARAYAWMRDADEAFRYLEETAQPGMEDLAGVPHNPLFRRLHDDPRWSEFLHSVGLAPEQLDAIGFNPTLPPDLKRSR